MDGTIEKNSQKSSSRRRSSKAPAFGSNAASARIRWITSIRFCCWIISSRKIPPITKRVFRCIRIAASKR